MDESTSSKQLITETPGDDNEEAEISTEGTSIEETTIPEQNPVVEEDFLENDEGTAAIPGMSETVDSDADVDAEDDQQERIKRVSMASRRLSTMARSYGNSIVSGISDDADGAPDGRPSVNIFHRKESVQGLTEDEEGSKEGERKVSISGAVKKKAIPKTHSRKPKAQSIESSQPISDQNKTQDTPGTMNYDDSNGDDFDEFFDFDNQQDFVLKHEYTEVVQEESVPSTVEEEELVLDRTPYYENYDTIMQELLINRIRNNLLQKLLIKLFRRRKIGNYLKDVEPPLEQILKYRQKLDTYKQFMEINEFERNVAGAEVNSLKAHRDKKNLELKNLFKSMQSREQNVGSGLIYSKTGNQIPDKMVERFIKRQATQANQVSTMRLKYIKLKGMVQEQQNAIEKLNTIEGNLHLTDYEQLKNENRTFADKLEERDVELTRLRMKCQHTIQILAHMREKTAALDLDVSDLKDEYELVDYQTADFREHLAYLKHNRDRYRQMSNKIQDESGLLTKPHLLIDMENSQEQLGKLENELNKCKKDVAKKKAAVRRLREKIVELTELANWKKANRSKTRLSTKSHSLRSKSENAESKNIYPRRPTLYRPVIKQVMFDDLVKIKPGVMVFDRKRRSFN